MMGNLQRLARDTAYLGHSSSVVRCFFRIGDDATNAASGVVSKRRVYAGRLSELEARFKQGMRPLLGETVESSRPATITLPQSVFGNQWHVFANAGGFCPDLRRTAVAARAFRAAVMSGFKGGPVPEVISGHRDDGRPTANPHMAVFALANVGWDHADGRLMGLALCLPQSASRADEDTLFRALGEIVQTNNSGDLEVSLNFPGGKTWQLVRQAEPSSSSLKPSRYLSGATVWATATPIALDRHPKATGNEALQNEIGEMISDACTRIGLPAPRKVVADKHSAIRGTAPARPSSRSPAWTHWTLPTSLKGRVLTHAILEFDTPVRGPIALGAGRFVGLGLCLPSNTRSWHEPA
jgi:CRISPR-associated protein Csb2